MFQSYFICTQLIYLIKTTRTYSLRSTFLSLFKIQSQLADLQISMQQSCIQNFAFELHYSPIFQKNMKSKEFFLRILIRFSSFRKFAFKACVINICLTNFLFLWVSTVISQYIFLDSRTEISGYLKNNIISKIISY